MKTRTALSGQQIFPFATLAVQGSKRIAQLLFPSVVAEDTHDERPLDVEPEDLMLTRERLEERAEKRKELAAKLFSLRQDLSTTS